MPEPGTYIERTAHGWNALKVLRPPTTKTDEAGKLRRVRHERLIADFSGPGSKARAIEAAGTNRELVRDPA